MNGPPRRTPPRLASWLLRHLLPRDGRAASIAGDLLEQFQIDRARHSDGRAALRYWRHVLSIAPRYLVARRRSSPVHGRMSIASRAALLLEALRQDVRYSVRSMFRNPGSAIAAVLTLGVGVGANTVIFSLLHGVVLRDLPYRDPDRLTLLWSVNLKQNQRDGTSYLNFLDWKEQSPAFENMAVYRRPEFTIGTITGVHEPERVNLALVGPGFFQVLGAAATLGRVLDDRDVRSAVISHGLWRQRFAGRTDIIGQPIRIDGATFETVGVMPPDFAFPNAGIKVWLPISVQVDLARAAANPQSRGGDPLLAIGRLSRDSTLGAARAELDTIAARLREVYPDHNEDKGVLLEAFTEHLLGARTAPSLWLLMGAVGLVFLIACANLANLALVRGAIRRHEFSVRVALGASRGRLVRQALTENVLVAVLAAAAGLLIAWVGAAALRTWASSSLPRLENVRLAWTVILFALAVSACGVAASLVPALRAPADNPGAAIAEGGPRASGGRRARRLRQGLVIAEIALAVMLVSGAGLLIRSFVRLQGVDRGFDSEHVLLLQVDLPAKYDGQTGKAEYFRKAFARIRALPGVVAAGAIDDFFIKRHGDLRVVVEGQPRPRPDDPAPRLIRDRVIPGYFEAAGIPLLKGRFLQDSDLVADLDRDHPRAVVINEAMARQFWPGTEPLGKRITYGSNPGRTAQWSRVVGVVADMRREKLDQPAFPCIFFPGFGPQMDVIVRTTGDPSALRDAIRAELLAVDPTVPPYGVVATERRLGETVAVRTLQTLLLAALAVAALVLAVIGVYGLVHQSVVARTQEIGVRMALGATTSSVSRMILADALWLAATGLTVGLAGAVALSRTIAAFLYATSPLDSLTFAVVPILLLVVTIVASLAPARRAARIDPIAALRVE